MLRKALFVIALIALAPVTACDGDAAPSGPGDAGGSGGSGGNGGAGGAGGAPAACTATKFADACAALAHSSWRSLEKGECGLGPDGVSLCTWHVTFDGTRPGEFDWQHSDYGVSGSWSCKGFEVTGKGSIGDLTGTYDPKCDRLTWAGADYERDPDRT